MRQSKEEAEAEYRREWLKRREETRKRQAELEAMQRPPVWMLKIVEQRKADQQRQREEYLEQLKALQDQRAAREADRAAREAEQAARLRERQRAHEERKRRIEARAERIRRQRKLEQTHAAHRIAAEFRAAEARKERERLARKIRHEHDPSVLQGKQLCGLGRAANRVLPDPLDPCNYRRRGYLDDETHADQPYWGTESEFY